MYKQYTIKTAREYLTFVNELSNPEPLPKLGNRTTYKYYNCVCKLLVNMKAGTSIEISNIKNLYDIEWFIKCVCLLIIESNFSFEFSNDYTKIKKL
jgi:hypothetical protein